jgi:type II secretory pathway component PulF
MGRLAADEPDEVRGYLSDGLRRGAAVGTLAKARPKLFTPLEAAILSAGDDAGTLDQSLGILADLFAWEYKRMLRIRLQMGYLLFLGLLASFVIASPVLHPGRWAAYLLAIALALAAFLLIGGVLISLVARTISGSARYTLPRLVRALVAGAETGLPIGRTVRLAVDTSGSAMLRRHLSKRSERELGTTPLATLFQGCRELPPGLIGRLLVADATGDYAGVLKPYADELEKGRK